jgi:hypothetical protein
MNSLLVDSRQNQSTPNFLNSGGYGISYFSYTKSGQLGWLLDW